MILKILLIVALCTLSLPSFSFAACSGSSPTLTAASCSTSDVQDCVTAASNGDTIMIPNGSCTWTTGIATTKQIKIRAQNYTPTQYGNTTRNVIITNNSSDVLFNMTSGDSYHIGIAGIRFTEGTGSANHIRMNGTGTKVPLVNDCYIQAKNRTGDEPNASAVSWLAQGGVVWNCYWAGIDLTSSYGALYVTSPRSWETASTMGTLDTNGSINLYIEDTTVFNTSAFPDISTGGRVVIRHSILDGTSGTTHGFTGGMGRHFEYYNDVFKVTTSERNQNRYFWARAGHGIIADSSADCGYNGYWLTKLLETICESGESYPVPKQVGWGHNGSDYVIDPIYIWNITYAGISVFSPMNTCDGYFFDPYTSQLHETSSPTYIQDNREVYVEEGAKPSYTKYTYPHPLRGETPSTTNFSGSSMGGGIFR